MRSHGFLAWSACLLVGAWLIRPLSQNVALFRALGGYEAVHIVAHVFLYGTLAALSRWAGLSSARAGMLAVCVAVMQESVQMVTAGRGPGLPELFDLGVDGVAIALALVVSRALRSRATPDPAPATPRAPETQRR